MELILLNSGYPEAWKDKEGFSSRGFWEFLAVIPPWFQTYRVQKLWWQGIFVILNYPVCGILLW